MARNISYNAMPFLTAATTLYEQRKREQEQERARKAQMQLQMMQEAAANERLDKSLGATSTESELTRQANARLEAQRLNPPITAYQRETMQQNQLKDWRTQQNTINTGLANTTQDLGQSNARRKVLINPPYNLDPNTLPQYIDQNTMNQLVGTYEQQNPPPQRPPVSEPVDPRVTAAKDRLIQGMVQAVQRGGFDPNNPKIPLNPEGALLAYQQSADFQNTMAAIGQMDPGALFEIQAAYNQAEAFAKQAKRGQIPLNTSQPSAWEQDYIPPPIHLPGRGF